MTDPTTQSPEALREAWDALQQREPGIRTRRAAAELEVAEAELVATGCGDGVRRIEADVERILPRLEALGPLMALTRNDLFVHEKTGVYGNVYTNPHVSSVIGDEIDLRIFPARWEHGFAVESERRRSRRRSLQFFDSHGAAVHKIFLRESSNLDAYDALVNDLLHADQSAGQKVGPEEPPSETRSDEEVDVGALESAWRTMEDTHEFFGMLREHEVSRTQALRLVSGELARPANSGAVRRLLETASDDGIELMIFVRSPGTIQIHHGPVDRIVDTPPWLNVLDPGFNLHVLEEGIAGTWVVRKPVETGWVTSVEVYDARDTLCALFFGCRKEGEPEDTAWRELAEALP